MIPGIKSEREMLIKHRNGICHRMVSLKADILYWERMAKKCKPDTQDRVDALKNAETARVGVKKDKFYLKCIDRLIEKSGE